MSLGPSEIIVVLLVALVVLGPDKLPAAARTLGKYVAEFRKFSASVQAQVDEALKLPDGEKDAQQAQSGESGNPANPDTTGFEMIDQARPAAENSKPPIDPNKDKEA